MKIRILTKQLEEIKNPCRLSGSPEDAIRYVHWETGKKTVFDATKEIDIDEMIAVIDKSLVGLSIWEDAKPRIKEAIEQFYKSN